MTLHPLLTAATAVAQKLQQLGVKYAVAGGGACLLHGSTRSTLDLDVVVDIDGSDVRALKEKIASIDPRFRSVGNSLYFGDIPIEFLTTRNFTWPQPLEDGCCTVTRNGQEITVLSPSALLISKSGRTANSIDATRPKTRAKLKTDIVDIKFLCSRIQHQDLAACLALYPAEKQARIRSNLEAISQICEPLRQLYEQL